MKDEITNKLLDFIKEIGIPVKSGHIEEEQDIPGTKIVNGQLVYDTDKLTDPGDLIHVAGHIASTPAAERENLNEYDCKDPAIELMTLGWSWAVIVKLGLDPKIVFHDNGYKGESNQIIMNFSGGHYVGLPMLNWTGMAADPATAQQNGVDPYPHMLKWLRD